MDKKVATKSWELYKKENPSTKMTEAEYTKKYLTPSRNPLPGPESPSGTPKQVVRSGPPKYPSNQLPEQKSRVDMFQRQHVRYPDNQNLIKNLKKYDEDKAIGALSKFIEAGKVKNKDQALKLMNHIGYNESEIADYLFKHLGKKTNFNQIKMFEDLGVIPKSYTKRKIDWDDTGELAKHVPDQLKEHYGLKLSSDKNSMMVKLLGDIRDLEKKINDEENDSLPVEQSER